MLSTALELIGKGFLVFPCRSGDKQPLVTDGFRAATRDREQVIRWWREWPDAWIGIWPARCDPPMVVLDFDHKHGTEPGLERLAEMEIDGTAPPTMEAVTPSGGRHLYYRLPENEDGTLPTIGNRALAKGVDVRSENGYVVWYGANGHDLTEAPPSLIFRLEVAEERTRNTEPATELDTPDQIRRATLAAEKLAKEGPKERYRKACAIKDWGVSAAECYRIMADLGFDDDGKLEAKVLHAYDYGQSAPGSKAAEAKASIERLKARAKAERKGRGVLSLATIEERAGSYLWYPYLRRGKGINLIAGRGGIGKGLAAMHFAACVTTGRPFPDGEPVAPGRVLWGETEDDVAETLKPRLLASGGDPTMFDVIAAPEPGLLTPDLLKDYDLLVLSPLLAYLGVDDINKEMAVRDAFEPVQRALEAGGTALLGICHINKKADTFGNDRLLGSVAFANVVRSVLMVAPDTELDAVRMAHTKHNGTPRGSDWLYKPHHVGATRESERVRVDWEPVTSNVDTESVFQPKIKDGPEASAMGWLVAALQDRGEVERKIIMAEAKEAGYTESAIQKAKYRSRRVRDKYVVPGPNQPPATIWWLE